MKAIITKYHPATNTKGSRISATAEGVARLYIAYPHELSGEAVYREAAEKLANKYGWLTNGTRLVAGGMPNGKGWAFCFTK